MRDGSCPCPAAQCLTQVENENHPFLTGRTLWIKPNCQGLVLLQVSNCIAHDLKFKARETLGHLENLEGHDLKPVTGQDHIKTRPYIKLLLCHQDAYKIGPPQKSSIGQASGSSFGTR